MARAVGIDLGTTNSVVSTLEAGEPVVIPNAEGSRTTPSVVGFSKNGEILVGEVAKRQAITNPDRTVRSVKRHMGDKSWSVDIDGKKWTPQEVSAQILLKLKRDAEAFLSDTVAQAVAIQRDGSIVAAGGGAGYFALARYTARGTLDPTFGTGGKVMTRFRSP